MFIAKFLDRVSKQNLTMYGAFRTITLLFQCYRANDNKVAACEQ